MVFVQVRPPGGGELQGACTPWVVARRAPSEQATLRRACTHNRLSPGSSCVSRFREWGFLRVPGTPSCHSVTQTH